MDTSVETPDFTFSGLYLVGALTGVTIAQNDTNGWAGVNFTIGDITLAGTGADITGLDLTALTQNAGMTIGDITIDAGSNKATGISGTTLTVTGSVTAMGDNTSVAVSGTDVTLGERAVVTSTGIGVSADNLTIKDGFTNGGNVFTADVTASVSVGAVNLTGATAASKITAPAFELAGNADIGGVTVASSTNLDIDLKTFTLTATTDFDHSSGTLTITGAAGSKATLLGLTGSFTVADNATVEIDGSNFNSSDTITIDSTSGTPNLVVGGTGTKWDGTTATASAKLDDNSGSGTDYATQVESASSGSGVYAWSAVEDPNSSGDWYLAFAAVNEVSTNSNATEVARLLHNKYSAWHAVRDHLISGTSRSGRGFLGQSPCDEVGACDPCGSILGTAARTAWVNYVGRANSYYDTAAQSDWKIGTDGVQVGSDLYRTKKTQVGVLFGYEGGKATLDAMIDEVKSDDVYVGFYGVRVLNNGADARIVFNKGWQDFDLSRAAGTATAAFDGETTELTLELGKRFYRNAWSFRPAVAFDYFEAETDGFTESGASTDEYSKSNFSQTFFRFGSDLRYEEGRFALNSGLYYSYDLHGDTLATSMYNGTAASVGSNLGRSVLTFNVGGSYRIGKCFTVFGGYQGEALLDADKDGVQHIGHVGGSWKW
jgi:hypothetical protein